MRPEHLFGLADVIHALETLGFQPEPERLKHSIARLGLAFVLGREAHRYSYCVPLQRALILADDTELLLRRELRAAIYESP